MSFSEFCLCLACPFLSSRFFFLSLGGGGFLLDTSNRCQPYFLLLPPFCGSKRFFLSALFSVCKPPPNAVVERFGTTQAEICLYTLSCPTIL